MRDSTVVLGCIIGLGLGRKDVYSLLKYSVFILFCSLVMLVAQQTGRATNYLRN